jgi:hypothetical protein
MEEGWRESVRKCFEEMRRAGVSDDQIEAAITEMFKRLEATGIVERRPGGYRRTSKKSEKEQNH